MSIYTRPNSPFWWAHLEGTKTRLSLKIHVTGATPAQTKANKKLAEAAYKSLIGDVARARFALPSTQPAITFLTHSQWHETHHTAHHKSASREIRILKHLRKFFGSCALEACTPTRWQEYVTSRTGAGVSVNTVGRELAVMKGVLSSAVGEHLEYSPLAGVKRKTVRGEAKRTIAAKEEPAFLAALKRIDLELHDLYVVGVGTLLRQENLLHLQRRSHRGDRLVVTTKTGPHSVPLKEPTELQRRAAAVLKKRMPLAPEGYFFPHWHARFAAYVESGHPRVLFLKKVRRAARYAGIPWGLKSGGIVWHTATRATGATRMLRDYQVDLKTVQFIGGWTSLDQMSAYLGLDMDHVFGRAHNAGRV